jgi:CHAT domain-containing protein
LRRSLSANGVLPQKTSRRTSISHKRSRLAPAFDKEIDELTVRYSEVEAQIRVSSPRYAALTMPEPIRVAEIQRDLLDQDTVLLEFATAGGQGWLWAVTRDTFTSYNLPFPARINSASRRIHQLLTARQPITGFSRLPFSREEAEAIAKFVPKSSLLKATGFQANRATATGSELSRYRIIHFATHGLLNSEHPLLSGLVFSLIDENGKPQDGFLRMHEIYNLQLPEELVVLSACQTALGEEIKGEGLVGLARSASSQASGRWTIRRPRN